MMLETAARHSKSRGLSAGPIMMATSLPEPRFRRLGVYEGLYCGPFFGITRTGTASTMYRCVAKNLG
jgi:hypothetical protein